MFRIMELAQHHHFVQHVRDRHEILELVFTSDEELVHSTKAENFPRSLHIQKIIIEKTSTACDGEVVGPSPWSFGRGNSK